jgi:hypothetical protein
MTIAELLKSWKNSHSVDEALREGASHVLEAHSRVYDLVYKRAVPEGTAKINVRVDNSGSYFEVNIDYHRVDPKLPKVSVREKINYN